MLSKALSMFTSGGYVLQDFLLLLEEHILGGEHFSKSEHGVRKKVIFFHAVLKPFSQYSLVQFAEARCERNQSKVPRLELLSRLGDEYDLHVFPLCWNSLHLPL